MTTIRTNCRFYLLRPDPELLHAVDYLLAHYAEVHQVSLMAYCLMSNHFHTGFYDRFGNRSLFLQDVHRGIANVVKALRGWRGAVFEGKPNIVRLLTPEAVIDKIAYLLANPVAAAAVERSQDWPGRCVAATRPGSKPRETFRPKLYFSEKGRMPERATLRLELPPMLVDRYGLEACRRRISAAAAKKEADARTELRRSGRRFMGAERCLRVHPEQRAKSFERLGGREPTFSTKGGGKDAFIKAARRLKSFRKAYRAAFEEWRKGVRDVVFPYGTWLMRVLHGVSCEATPAPT